MREGMGYHKIKKVVSITIAYFDIGDDDGEYVYKGRTKFKGIHTKIRLKLSEIQKLFYRRRKVYEMFPEYWLIKVDGFDDRVKDKLDEWVYFLKNGEVRDEFTAPGLSEAKEKLREMGMSELERREYEGYLSRLRDEASEKHTEEVERVVLEKVREEGVEQGIAQEREKAEKRGEKRGREAERKKAEKALKQEKAKALIEKEKALKQEKEQTARTLLTSGVSDEIILASTGLTKKDLKNIKNNLE